MSKSERIATIKFLQQLKKDLLIQVLKNIAQGNNDNTDKWSQINNIDNQLFIDRALKTR